MRLVGQHAYMTCHGCRRARCWEQTASLGVLDTSVSLVCGEGKRVRSKGAESVTVTQVEGIEPMYDISVCSHRILAHRWQTVVIPAR